MEHRYAKKKVAFFYAHVSSLKVNSIYLSDFEAIFDGKPSVNEGG